MKFILSVFIIILLAFTSYAIYMYLNKYKSIEDKLMNVENERNVLLKRMASLEREGNKDTIVEVNSTPITPYGKEIVDSLELQVNNIIMEIDSQTYVGAAVEIPLDNFFDPESITVWNEGGKDLLRRIGDIIRRSGNASMKFSIYVDSYIPEEGEIYAIKTPWEVAAKRGLDLVQFLRDSCQISETEVTLEIFGSQFPVGDTTTREGRFSTRRVIFTLVEK